jgi:hypothetical protein
VAIAGNPAIRNLPLGEVVMHSLELSSPSRGSSGREHNVMDGFYAARRPSVAMRDGRPNCGPGAQRQWLVFFGQTAKKRKKKN